MATKQTREQVAAEEPQAVPGPIESSDHASFGRARLAQKLCEISLDVGSIEKRGHNDHFNYNFVTDSDVAEAFRDVLARHGVAMMPRVNVVQSRPVKTSQGRETFITEVTCEIDFICSETGAVLTATMPGAGEDGMDKGPYKGTTGAIKYTLLKTFNISTGDDPESGSTRDNGSAKINDKQRSVIWGRARGADIENDLLFRIINYRTGGKVNHPDQITTRHGLDAILASIDHFGANKEADLIELESWEKNLGGELPPDHTPSGVDGSDDDIPF